MLNAVFRIELGTLLKGVLIHGKFFIINMGAW